MSSYGGRGSGWGKGRRNSGWTLGLFASPNSIIAEAFNLWIEEHYSLRLRAVLVAEVACFGFLGTRSPILWRGFLFEAVMKVDTFKVSADSIPPWLGPSNVVCHSKKH